MTLFSFFPISTHKIQDPQLQMGKIQNRLHEKNINPPATYGGNTNTPATYGKIETVHLYMGKIQTLHLYMGKIQILHLHMGKIQNKQAI